MRTLTDNQLLEAWAARRSDPAFSELVRRYVDLVHSAALRQVGGPPLADDVAQAVFLVLARKAASLRRTTALAGWLYRTTRLTALGSIRSDARRRQREREAAAMNSTTHALDSENSTWTQVAPLLDEAMATLPESDRNALLLRFFQAKPMDAVGEHLGVSEEAAKKRVSRAVDRIRAYFARRGVTLSAAALTGAVAHNAVQAAPASLAAKIAAAQAGAAVSGGAAALAAAALRQMLWAKLCLAFGCGAAAVATVVVLSSLLLAGFGATEKVAASEAPRTYNLTADWSNSTNPNGVWSYNLDNEPMAELQTYWWGQAGWGGGPPGDGCIMKGNAPKEGTKDPTGRLQTQAHDWQDGDVMMHSLSTPYGGETRFVNASWTSPADGTIDISGRAWDGQIFPERDIIWSLIVDGQTIAERSSVRGIFRTDKAAKFSANVVGNRSLTGISISKGAVVELRVATVTDYGHFVGVEEQIKLKPKPGSAVP